MCYRECAVAAARKCVTIEELGGVNALANGQAGQDLAVIGVHHDQLLRLAAADEEAVVLCVDRHSHRCAARGNRPARDDLAGLDVDHGDLILIHQIDVDPALTVGGKELGRSAELDGRIDLSRFGVNIGLERHQHSLVTGDGKDLFRCGFEDNAVSIRLGSNSPQNCVALEVEDLDGALATAVSNEPPSRSGSEGDAMSPLLAGNVSDGLARLGVYHQRMCAARYIKVVSSRIDGEIVPSTVTANVECFHHRPAGLGEGGCGGQENNG